MLKFSFSQFKSELVRSVWFWLGGFLLLADRALKIISYTFFKAGSLKLGAGFWFSYSLNQGAAFGWRWPKGFLIVVSLIALLVAVYFFIFKSEAGLRVSWYLLILGVSSNLVDRLWLGGVFDYLSWVWGPVFNLADVYISLALLLLAWKWPSVSAS